MRRILLTVLALVFPLGALRAQMDAPVTHEVRFYPLGVDSTNRSRADSALQIVAALCGSRDVRCTVIGFADATPWKQCKTATCSAQENMVLALRRANKFRQDLATACGISRDRIATSGEVSKERGGQHRGLTIYIDSIAPAPAVREPVIDTALERRVSNLESRMTAAEKSIVALNDTIADLRDSLKTTTQATTTQNTVSEKTETSKQNQIATVHSGDVDIGFGFAALTTRGLEVAVPTFKLIVKPLGSPVEVELEGGFRPSRSENICNRADLFGALKGNKRWDPVGISVGVFTAREICVDGGPRLAERSVGRTYGVLAGPNLNFNLRRDYEASLSIALSWSTTYHAQTGEKFSGLGLQLGVGARTANIFGR